MFLKPTLLVLIIVGLAYGQVDRDPNLRRCNYGRGRHLNWQEFGGSCYVHVRDRQLSWYSAWRQCLSYGGNLVSISSGDENRFVADLAGGREAWIGLHDDWPPAGMAALGAPLQPLKLDPKWDWSDYTPFPGPNRYQNWGPAQPSGNQDCVQINYGGWGLWDDNDFWTRLPFVCEKPVRQENPANPFRRNQ